MFIDKKMNWDWGRLLPKLTRSRERVTMEFTCSVDGFYWGPRERVMMELGCSVDGFYWGPLSIDHPNYSHFE
jgi:hypothetical protein